MLIFFPTESIPSIVDVFQFVSIRINHINFINTRQNVSKNTKTNGIKNGHLRPFHTQLKPTNLFYRYQLNVNLRTSIVFNCTTVKINHGHKCTVVFIGYNHKIRFPVLMVSLKICLLNSISITANYSLVCLFDCIFF